MKIRSMVSIAGFALVFGRLLMHVGVKYSICFSVVGFFFMTRQLVEIHPTELKFIFELKKQSSCSIQLLNTSDQYIAYKVKTTSPKKYCVRPNVGVVSPHSPCEIIVTMQGQRTAPPDMQCKDKFLVQSTVVPEGTTMDQITSNMFAKENGGIVDEKKLKVALISPPHSPVLQPISGVTDQEPVFGTPKPVAQDNSSSEDSHEDNPPPTPQTNSFSGIQKPAVDITFPSWSGLCIILETNTEAITAC